MLANVKINDFSQTFQRTEVSVWTPILKSREQDYPEMQKPSCVYVEPEAGRNT